jgi:hypothetical protein
LKTFADKEIGRERIGNVEGEVADHWEFGRSEVVESAKVADEDSIGFGALDEAEKSSFARLLNSGGSEKDGNLGGFSKSFDGRGKTAKILKVEIE